MHPFHRTELLVGRDNWRRLKATRVLVVGLGAFVVSGPLLGGRAASLLRPGRVQTFQHRVLYWQAGMEMAAEGFPLGIGLETYHIDYRAHQRPELAGTVQWYAHNDYLQILIELGPLGLAALFWLLWRVGGAARETLRAPTDPSEAAVIAACAAGAAAALLHSLVEYNLYVSATALPVFVCFGIIGACHARLKPAVVSAAAPRRPAPLLSHCVLALGAAAVLLAVRPLIAETLLQRSRFNAPYAVALCPVSAHLWMHLGDAQAGRHLAWLGMGHVPADADAAKRSYHNAIRLSPRDPWPHAQLGDLLRKTRKVAPIPADNNKGLESLRRACALDRYSAPLRWQLGLACLAEGRTDEGRRELRFCLDRCRPDEPLEQAVRKMLSALEEQGASDDE